MTYEANESSRHSGQPVELFKFQVGFGKAINSFWLPLISSNLPSEPSPPGGLVSPIPITTNGCDAVNGWTLVRDTGQTTCPDNSECCTGCIVSCIPTSPDSAVVVPLFTDGTGFTVWGAYHGPIGGGGSHFYMRASLAGFVEPDHEYTVRLLVFRLGGQTVDVIGVRIGDGVTSASVQPVAPDSTWEYIDLTFNSSSAPDLTVDVGHFEMQIGAAAIVGIGGAWLYDPALPAAASGSTLNYTSDGLPHTFRGDTYEPAIFTASEITSGGGESADGEFDISMPRDHAIAMLVRDGLPTAPLTVTHYRVHRPDIAAGTSYATPFVGQATRARFKGAECVITFATPRSLLDRKKPSVLCQQHCNWMLYDARCQLDRNDFAFTSTITAIESNTVTIAGLATESGADSTKFQFGSILVPSGEYAFIENQGGDVVTLLNPPQTMAVGDAVTAYQGCDRTVTTCQNRFNNLVHFGGRPTMKSKNVFGPTGLEL